VPNAGHVFVAYEALRVTMAYDLVGEWIEVKFHNFILVN
jgi:hypothetical protein